MKPNKKGFCFTLMILKLFNLKPYLQKSCKHSTEFLHTLQPTFLNENMCHNHSTIMEIITVTFIQFLYKYIIQCI